jgi:hypothetical protein
LVGRCGDLVRVASWRRQGLGRAGNMFAAGGGPRARRRSSGVGYPCPRGPRLGSGEARSSPSNGLIPDLIAPIRPLQLYADGGYQLRIRSLEGTPNYGPRHKDTNWKTFKNLNLFRNSTFFEINMVGAVLLLWALILSPPLAWIAKNRYFDWNMSPYCFLPIGTSKYEWRIIPIWEMAEYRQRIDNTDGVEWKRCLCRILHFPFNLRLNTQGTHGNILVLALAQER